MVVGDVVGAVVVLDVVEVVARVDVVSAGRLVTGGVSKLDGVVFAVLGEVASGSVAEPLATVVAHPVATTASAATATV